MLLVFFICTFFSIFSSNDVTQQNVELFKNISKIKEQGFWIFEQNGWSIAPWGNFIKNYVKYRYATKERTFMLHFEIFQYQAIWNHVEVQQLLQNADLIYLIFTMQTEQNNNNDLVISNLLQTIPEIHHNKIEGVDISDSKISVVPDLLARFINLKLLSIQKNGIETLPKWLKNMQKIEMFFGSENQITSMENIMVHDTFQKRLG